MKMKEIRPREGARVPRAPIEASNASFRSLLLEMPVQPNLSQIVWSLPGLFIWSLLHQLYQCPLQWNKVIANLCQQHMSLLAWDMYNSNF